MIRYTTSQNWATLIARIFFSVIFIFSGVNKILNFNGTVMYMTQAGLQHPYVSIFAVLAIIFELVGGILILLGWYTRFGAFLIFVFTLLVTFAIHHFWSYPAAEMQGQMTHFLKNLCLAAAALYIMAFGAGDFSLDHMRSSRRFY